MPCKDDDHAVILQQLDVWGFTDFWSCFGTQVIRRVIPLSSRTQTMRCYAHCEPGGMLLLLLLLLISFIIWLVAYQYVGMLTSCTCLLCSLPLILTHIQLSSGFTARKFWLQEKSLQVSHVTWVIRL